MRRRRWTQGQLEHASGVSQQHISQIARGERIPGIAALTKLAKALGVSLDWLAGLPPQPGVDTLEPDARELVEAYSRLDEAHQAVVLNMVRDLAGKR